MTTAQSMAVRVTGLCQYTSRASPHAKPHAKHVTLRTMLEMRPGCECCDTDLPADAPGARICSFECTFCTACAENRLHGRCPNCGGELVARPIRPAAKLAGNPASTRRVFKPGCAAS